MAVVDWGCRSPCTEVAHEDFITRNNEIGITVKSLRLMQLDLLDPKLKNLAAMGANDHEYQQMMRHHTGKLIDNNGSNILIPKQGPQF